MFNIQQALISYPKKCKKCKNLVLFPCELIDNYYYYKCSFCLESFLWTSNTLFDRNLISFSKFEKLILLYIENKSVRETYEIMINSEETKLNKKTVARYFNLLNLFSFEFYMEKLDSTFFDGEVELDETLLFKEKKTTAIHRRYKLGKIWIFGLRKRNSKEFLVFPIAARDSSAIITNILKYVKQGSKLYTDCYSVYVNTRAFPMKSKLEIYGYNHQFINHKFEFVSKIFNHVHTNTVERLWRELKADIKMKKTRHKYLLHLTKFQFTRSLSRSEQFEFLLKKLHSN